MAGITKQVSKAIEQFQTDYKHPLPNFPKKDATKSSWSLGALFSTKVFIQGTGANLRFIELNWLQKAIRWMKLWYSDTVFKDGTVSNVTVVANKLLVQEPKCKEIRDLLNPLQTTTSDHMFLNVILFSIKEEATHDQISDFKSAVAASKDDISFSEKFLSEAFKLPEEYKIREKLEGFLEILKTSPVNATKEKAELNLALIKQMRGMQLNDPSEKLPIPINTAAAIRRSVDQLLKDSEGLASDLENHETILKMRTDAWRPAISFKVSREDATHDIHRFERAVFDTLVGKGVYQCVASAYLKQFLPHVDEMFYRAASRCRREYIEERKVMILQGMMGKVYAEPKTPTLADQTCLDGMLATIEQISYEDRLQELEGAVNEQKENLAFSEEFLAAALPLASKYKIRNTIMCILYVLQKSPDAATKAKADLNQALLVDEQFPCKELPISKGIQEAVRTQLDKEMYRTDHSKVLENGLTREDYTRLEKKKTDSWQLSEDLQRLCLEERKSEPLSSKLIEYGAYKCIVSDFFTRPNARIDQLLNPTMSVCRKEYIQQKMEEIDGALLREITGYDIKNPKPVGEQEMAGARTRAYVRTGFTAIKALVGQEGVGLPQVEQELQATNTLEIRRAAADEAYDQNIAEVLSGLLPNNGMTWRGQVATELAQEKYQAQILARIAALNKEEEEHRGNSEYAPQKVVQSIEEYFEWIKLPGSPIGEPEAHAISQITRRPVITVQGNCYQPYNILYRYNFNSQGAPLVFCDSLGSGECLPMIKKLN